MKQRKITYLTSKIFRIFAYVIIGIATTLSVKAADVTFNGTTNTDWATATNWSTGTVPTSADVITINNAKTVVISSTTTVAVERITLNAGSSLTNNGTLSILPTTSVGSALTVSGNCTFINLGTLTVSSSSQTTASNTITIAGEALSTNNLTFNGTNNIAAKSGVNVFSFNDGSNVSIGGTGFTVGSLAAPSPSTIFGLGGVNSSLTVNNGTTITMYIGTGMKGFRLSGSTSITNNGTVNIHAGSAYK